MHAFCSHRPVAGPAQCCFRYRDGRQGRGYSVRNSNSRQLLQPQFLFDFLHSREEFSETMDPGNLLFSFG